MILRTLTLCAGLLGGGAASQFPEFSQQYAQRLGGAVSALGDVVADFDASAQAAGLSREAALAQMSGTAFLDRRRADMKATFDRHARLSADLVHVQDVGPFMRAYHAARLTDHEIARQAWAAYQPAMPLTFAGLIFAGAGFLLSLIGVGMFLRLAVWPLRRRVPARSKAA